MSTNTTGTPESTAGRDATTLKHGEIGLAGVMMPGLAQVAPAFNLFFTAGVMAGLAGPSVPLIFLISLVGLVATAASLALFSGVYPSAGSFLTYIAKAIGPRTSVVVGVITLLGYIIAFGGIYIFVGQYIVANVLGSPHIWGRFRGVLPRGPGLRRVRGRGTAGRGNPQPAAQRADSRHRRGRGQRLPVRVLLLRADRGVWHQPHRGPGRRPQPVPHGRARVHPGPGPAHHVDLPDQRDKFVRGRQHADIPGAVRGRARRLWSRTLAAVSPRFRTPAVAAVAFVAPSIAIGVISTAVTDPGTAAGFLGTYGILGLVLMYLMANVALVAQWVRFRRAGVRKNVWAWVVTPVIGICVLAIPVWGDLRPGEAAPYSYLPWLTIALIAVGVVYMLALQGVRPRVMQNAAALLEGDEAATDTG